MFLASEKLDGISISLKYVDGELVQALTLGSGNIGENITQNVLKMKNVKKTLLHSFTGHIRGEIILLKSDHKKYFPTYANPRNAASGIAKRYDGEGSEHLTILFYNINGEDFKTEEQIFKRLEELGLQTPFYKLLDINGCLELQKEYQETKRETLDYDIDGIVYILNDVQKQIKMGIKGRGPAAGIAFKFAAAAKETIVRDIVNQVGNTGRITPVAIFDAVDLAGVKVERCSLYNYSYIQEIGIGIGATVIAERANDVIPRIEVVLEKTSIAQIPKTCPECNTPTERKGEYLLCPNKESCPAQILGRISTWVNELGILEWGDKVLQKFITAGLIKDIPDIYKLQSEQIASIERMGEKSAKALLKELDKYREVPLHNLIGGLGIENVATSTVKLVTSAGYDTLEKIQNITFNELINIDGFGEIKANAFLNGVKENKERIQSILDQGVKIKIKTHGQLSGKKIAITGSSQNPRKVLIQFIENNAGEYKKSVTKDCTHLVIEDVNSTSSKALAAKKLGITLITENDLLNLELK